MFARLGKHCALVSFLLLLAAGPMSYLLFDPVKTRASVPAPDFSWEDLRRGEYASDGEEYLRESSSLVRVLRSVYSLPLLRAGLLESPLVRFGSEPWLFYRPGTRVADPAALIRLRSRRLNMFSALKLELEKRGIELVVLLVPDKSRVYADLCYGREGMPRLKAGLYNLILSELRQAGVRVVDPLADFREARRREPAKQLYYPGDTHWTPAGMRVAAADLVQELESGGIPLGGEPGESILADKQLLQRSPDLVDMLGLDPSWLAEYRQAQEGLRMLGVSAGPNSRVGIALAGGSFSERGFAAAIAEACGEPVDDRGVLPGQGPMAGLRETLYLLRQERLRPRLLVWEFVERSYLESKFWLRGPAELGLR